MSIEYKIKYIERPTLNFETLEVLTPAGPAKIVGEHKWNPIKVAFDNADEVYNYHAVQGGGQFDIDFTCQNERWLLTRCSLHSRLVQPSYEFVVSYQFAQQIMMN